MQLALVHLVFIALSGCACSLCLTAPFSQASLLNGCLHQQEACQFPDEPFPFPPLMEQSACMLGAESIAFCRY